MSEEVEHPKPLFKDKKVFSIEEDKTIPFEFEMIVKAIRDNPIKELDGISSGLISYYTDRIFTIEQVLGTDLHTLVLEPTDEQRRATHAYTDGDYASFVEYMAGFQNTGNIRFLIDSSKEGNERYVVIDNDNKKGVLVRREFADGKLVELYICSLVETDVELGFNVQFGIYLNPKDENSDPIKSKLILTVHDYRSQYLEERRYSGLNQGTEIVFLTQSKKEVIKSTDPKFNIDNADPEVLGNGRLIVFGGRKRYEEYRNQNKKI